MYIVFLGLYTFYYLSNFCTKLIISFSSINLFINLFLIIIPAFIIVFLFKLVLCKNNKEENYLYFVKTAGLVYCFLVTFLSLVETLFYYNCESIYNFFSSILLIGSENIEEEISYMLSLAPFMLLQTLFYGLFSVAMYRIYRTNDEDEMRKYNFIMFVIVNFLYSIFIFIGFIFLINNKINIFNINHLYEENYKNILLSLTIFLEILFRLSLNIIIIKSLKKSGSTN
ncbi:MAG: hypothetical protein SPI52_03260 [Bacilli bacterium]|nr:hypothetical protein [Bacilli bacterium]